MLIMRAAAIASEGVCTRPLYGTLSESSVHKVQIAFSNSRQVASKSLLEVVERGNSCSVPARLVQAVCKKQKDATSSDASDMTSSWPTHERTHLCWEI